MKRLGMWIACAKSKFLSLLLLLPFLPVKWRLVETPGPGILRRSRRNATGTRGLGAHRHRSRDFSIAPALMTDVFTPDKSQVKTRKYVDKQRCWLSRGLVEKRPGVTNWEPVGNVKMHMGGRKTWDRQGTVLCVHLPLFKFGIGVGLCIIIKNMRHPSL